MISQQFSSELDKKLCTAPDRLRSNLDAAVYKHAVLGLIFLKYVPDSFAQRRAKIAAMLKDPKRDFFFDPGDYSSTGKYEAAMHAELEERDYCLEQHVFEAPALARWKTVQDSAKLAPGTEITVRNGKTTTYKITSTGKLIDDALEAIEKENPKLKGVLDRRYTQLQIHPDNLSSLIDLIDLIDLIAGIAGIAFLHAKDILGHVYDWSGAAKSLWKQSLEGERGGAHQNFLSLFALPEGKKGGQRLTLKAIIPLIAKVIERYKGRVYEPAMNSGDYFVRRSSSRLERNEKSWGPQWTPNLNLDEHFVKTT